MEEQKRKIEFLEHQLEVQQRKKSDNLHGGKKKAVDSENSSSSSSREESESFDKEENVKAKKPFSAHATVVKRKQDNITGLECDSEDENMENTGVKVIKRKKKSKKAKHAHKLLPLKKKPLLNWARSLLMMNLLMKMLDLAVVEKPLEEKVPLVVKKLLLVKTSLLETMLLLLNTLLQLKLFLHLKNHRLV